MMSKRISLKIKTSRCIITGCNSCERVYVRASTVFEGPDFPSVFRAKQDDTFILSSCNNGRDSGSQFNHSNVLDESTSREKCAHALQSSDGRSQRFAARNAFGTNFGSADDRYPRRTNLRESMHTAKVGNYAKCQRAR